MAIENLQGISYAVITPVFILATVSIFLRIYSRAVVLKAFDWDDWAMAALLVGSPLRLRFFIQLTNLCSSSTQASRLFYMFSFTLMLESESKPCWHQMKISC